jgi:predicted transcriptional regulator
MEQSDPKSFVLDSSEEAELLLSLAEADRGELIPAEEVMRVFREDD